MKLEKLLLLATLLLAVSLSLGLWLTGVLPFDFKTVTLHIVSIYIGISGILLYQEYLSRHNE